MNERLILASAGRKLVEYTILALALGIFWSTSASAQMSHEEVEVRTAYARLAYASELHAVRLLEAEALTQQNPPVDEAHMANVLGDSRLTFQLSNFRYGNIQDITKLKMGDLAGPPSDERLDVGFGVISFQDEGKDPSQFFEATVKWTKREPDTPEKAALYSLTYAELYKLENPAAPHVPYSRYATYSVIASYRGVTRGPFKAFFVFNADSAGNEKMRAYDVNVDSVGLGLALSNRLYPKALLETSVRQLSVVSEWLQSTQMDEQTCSTWRGDVCCDLTALKCGVASSALKDAMAKPVPFNPATEKGGK